MSKLKKLNEKSQGALEAVLKFYIGAEVDNEEKAQMERDAKIVINEEKVN